MGGMILGLLMGCNNGVAELEKKNTFFDSIIKIGQGFQEIFGNFGNAMGNALGFNFIKPEDNRSKVKDHFKNIGDGLKNTKGQLEELSKKIVATPHADTKNLEAIIKGSSEVITKLIDSISKLAGSVGSTKIAEGTQSTGASAAEASDQTSVDAFIDGVKGIIETATSSGVEIGKGNDGVQVKGGDDTAPAALVGKASAAAPNANAGPKLADEVAKADPWAMIDKIKSSETKKGALSGNDNSAGVLATGTGAASVGAKSNADLAAAVALKAITKDGKFTNANNEDGAVKAAAASAVNKVLGILDVIISRTVNSHLEKVRKAVEGIQYSETTGTEVTETKN